MTGVGRVIRNVFIALTMRADDAGFRKANDTVAKVRDTILSLGVAAAGAFAGVAAGIAGLVVEGNRLGTFARQVENLSVGLQMTTDEAQEMLGVLELMGTGADENDLADAFGTIQDRIEDARAGTQSYIDDLALLNLKASDFSGRPIDAFMTFSDAVARAENKNKALAAAVRILGDDMGHRLMPILAQGSQGIAEMRGEIRKSGLVLEEDGIKQAERYRFQMTLLTMTFRGFRNVAGKEITEALAPTLEIFNELLATYGALIQTRIQDAFKAVRIAGWRLFGVLVDLNDQVHRLPEGWKSAMEIMAAAATFYIVTLIMPQIYALGAGLAGVMTAMGAFLGIGAAPALVLAGALMLVVAVFEDLYSYFQGRDTITSRIIDGLIESGDEMEKWGRRIQSVLLLLKEFGKFALTIQMDILGGLAAAFVNILPPKAVKRVKDTFNDLTDFLYSIISPWETFTKVFEQITAHLRMLNSMGSEQRWNFLGNSFGEMLNQPTTLMLNRDERAAAMERSGGNGQTTVNVSNIIQSGMAAAKDIGNEIGSNISRRLTKLNGYR